VRCAIYTRKSTDEGLDREFNTLQAQRVTAESYIASQRDEGWVALPDVYDDGGFSGATTQRPALQRLLADIDAGKIDCVVVYKYDRLSRSMLDFLQMLDIFNQLRLREPAVRHLDADGRGDAQHPADLRAVRKADDRRADARQDARRPSQGEMDRRHEGLGLRPRPRRREADRERR